MIKLENFGFKINKLYLQDIIITNPLFSQLNDDDLNEITSKKHILDKPKKTTLFSKGEIAQGVYVVTQGIANQQYDENQTHTINLGNTIGINVLVDENSKYDTTVVCESHCTLIFIPIHQMQKFVSNYSEFENGVYISYFLHKIHFLEQYPRLVEVNLLA